MNVLIAGLALAVLPVSGEMRQSPGAAPVTIYSTFEHAPQDALLATLEEEVAAIMEPAGIQFEWHQLSPDSANRVSVELVVVTFRGSCEAGAPLVRVEEGPLGRTHTSDGEVLPFIDIDCNRIRGFLKTSLAAFEPEDRPEALGRATARVLAHELFHVLAHTRKHGAWGVAKPCYTVHDLLAEIFLFEPREQELLRQSRSRSIPEQADPPVVTTGQ
jgi:hypothetical protein